MYEIPSPTKMPTGPLINTNDGKVLAKKYGFQNVEPRIRSSHNKINLCNKEMKEQFLSKILTDFTLAQSDSNLKGKLFQYLNGKHNRILNELKINKTKGKHSI